MIIVAISLIKVSSRSPNVWRSNKIIRKVKKNAMEVKNINE
jgi:hypothetical protein